MTERQKNVLHLLLGVILGCFIVGILVVSPAEKQMKQLSVRMNELGELHDAECFYIEVLENALLSRASLLKSSEKEDIEDAKRNFHQTLNKYGYADTRLTKISNKY